MNTHELVNSWWIGSKKFRTSNLSIKWHWWFLWSILTDLNEKTLINQEHMKNTSQTIKPFRLWIQEISHNQFKFDVFMMIWWWILMINSPSFNQQILGFDFKCPSSVHLHEILFIKWKFDYGKMMLWSDEPVSNRVNAFVYHKNSIIESMR